jgi:hypothetical protein
VLERAESNRVMLRLLGGIAFYLRCPSARSGNLVRSYEDVDFIGHARQSSEIKRLFSDLGYVPRERFNAIHSSRRLGFTDSGQQKRVDVFLDVFEMCHRFDLKERMEIDRQTIPLADLLATKLQIIQTNQKDFGDMICLLLDHEIGDMDLQDTINGKYLARLCGEDWGIYKTFTMKLTMLGKVVQSWDLKQSERELITKRIEQLSALIVIAPKSLAWKMRATIGERVRWYERPEEDMGLVEQAQAES